MQSMIVETARNSNESIPLETLSLDGNRRLATIENGWGGSPSGSSSPEALTATKISLKKVQRPVLRATLRDVMSNNIARHTLKTSITFGVLTMMYYVTSLVPAFRAAGAAVRTLEMQIKSGDDSAQGLAYAFLKECTRRKVNSMAFSQGD